MKQLTFSIIFLISIVSGINAQASDAALRRTMAADAADIAANGSLAKLSAAEHNSRAEIYSSNRLFPQARGHWQAIFDNYPEDPVVPKALFGTARSYMWEREYLKAVEWFDRLTKDFLGTKEGREGLAYKGASYVRAGKNLEAAKTYEQYATMFPDGEKIDSAHLNIIDAYREAGKYDDANRWVDRTIDKFAGTPTEANAIQSRIRMEIFRKNWPAAVTASDALLAVGSLRGSMASTDEAKYLKAFALESSGKRAEAMRIYASIDNASYFGGLADKHTGGNNVKTTASSGSASLYNSYPVKFSFDLVKHSKKHKIDPRFLLAIMKQESSFRSNAKSPAGARGLLQLVFDTAIKYKDEAGYPNLKPDDLYSSSVNIAIGSVYVSKLKDEFDGMYEAIASSYNAGEDNTARWLARTSPKDPGIFASEVGFAETKNYVFKVMNNYRMYQMLYDEDLNKR